MQQPQEPSSNDAGAAAGRKHGLTESQSPYRKKSADQASTGAPADGEAHEMRVRSNYRTRAGADHSDNTPGGVSR